MNYLIRNVISKENLEKTFAFYKKIFRNISNIDNPEYSIEKWENRMKKHSDLMLYAWSNSEVIGIVFGRINDDKTMAIGPVAVDENYRGFGIAKEMVLLLEKRALNNGIQTINLGAVEFAENFYRKLGYSGSLLIQSQIHSVEQLLSLKNRCKVKFTKIYDGKVNQLCLELMESDRELMKEYETAFPGCYTIMLFSKEIRKN